MRLVLGEELGLKLCELFGFDPDKTGKIVIVAKPGDVATITSERCITEVEQDKLIKIITSFNGTKKFKIVEET